MELLFPLLKIIVLEYGKRGATLLFIFFSENLINMSLSPRVMKQV